MPLPVHPSRHQNSTNAISPQARHMICAFHQNLHDMSHFLYHALEKIFLKTDDDIERAWALRLLHGHCFFRFINDGTHRHWMKRMAAALTYVVLAEEDDLWQLLPRNELPCQHFNMCYTYITKIACIEFDVLNALSTALFDSIAQSTLYSSTLGVLSFPSCEEFYPEVTFYNNQFFLERLHKTCPFIFHAISSFLNPEPCKTKVLPHIINEFYMNLYKKTQCL